jgi:hypothetical protein
MEKVKIILDADVLIHFAKAGRMSMLPEILPEYDHVVLNVVYDEIKSIQNQLDNQILFLKNISKETFNPAGEMLVEYARLLQSFGKGESACMAYCRYTHNVIGSSNLKDIKEYCEKQQITYLTTLDFLYYGIKRGKMSVKDCEQFVDDVVAKGSKLPKVDFEKYMPNTQL